MYTLDWRWGRYWWWYSETDRPRAYKRLWIVARDMHKRRK